MKKYIYYFITLVCFSFLQSCEKTASEALLSPYVPTNIDENAGNWKTFVLSSPTEVSIAAPAASNDPNYLKEIDSLKNIVAPNLTNEQRQIVAYWGAGAVYRWNEIARELAARYNSAPAANAEGKYPVPDATNPLADPKFPFANPPYASRALAYLSVAQFDALVSAWKYKYQYNRQSPGVVDKAIKPLLPVNTLPSYPSEDAVVGQASYVILLAMFPGEGPFLKSKLEECKNARLWAGMNVSSDLNAGVSLGGAVAAKVMVRARADGMGAANNQAATPDMIARSKSLGFTTVWTSQESPARPPMLPTFGNVKTWNFDRATMEAIRPAIPYIEGSAEFKKDFEELQTIDKNQTREQAAIANFWADGPGTYTPPGHWHRYGANAGFEAKYSEVRMARMLAYLGTAEMDAGIGCWDTKFYYYSPRPQQYGLKTSVGLPNFPSYTSGHSTFSAAGAEVLSAFFPEKASTFNSYAQQASDSRVYGLIHWRIDCSMGLKHGKVIGQYAVKRASQDGAL
ncbi:phosphatase PAP2 family protein [Aquirufa nivalisilvae]|uniref:phosphatase PAP2 family protein n=1 Tax=Aquirufa nivalisilvae TaxID=2516557 RepID=UPI0010328003|nr:phosphatase PAP2 family protein [Aquirufa nivalisilvae]TBH76233.1 phosphatase PAP2 family protein [Aquirufa nivalisilvae]